MTTEELETTKDNIVEEIQALPENEQQKVLAEVVGQVKIYQGPIPSPEEMQAYKNVDPEILKYIISEARANGEHIRECEKNDVRGKVSYNLRGQIFSFLVAFSALVLCGLSVVFWDSLAGNIFSYIFGAAGVTPIITSFFEHMRGMSKQDRDGKS